MSKIHGGEIVAKMLHAEGVEVVFGIIDGTYFGFYSNLAKYGIRLITPRHESSAVHMAGAYARITGKLGVCMASNGPGVANALPGVAVENGEGNRVLLITSCRRQGIGYPDRGGTYQYFNQQGVIAPMAKWSGAAPDRARIPEMMRRAFRIAERGRPGVVHVDIPENVMNTKDAFDERDLRPPSQYRRATAIAPDTALVERAADMLVDAKLPMIHAGSGVIHARAFAGLRRLSELLDAPVTTSWGARGALPESLPQAIPMVHLELNNRVRNEADLALVLGSRLGETDWWGKAPYWRSTREQPMIQVDADEEILGLNRAVEVAVLADVGAFLDAVVPAVEARQGRIDRPARRNALTRYGAERRKDRGQLDQARDKRTDGGVHPAAVPTACQAALPDDTIWVFDGGNTAIWGNFYTAQNVPGSVLSTFKFGMLGAGVGQALGAKAAAPHRTVCCIIGDGAMGFHPQEVETAVRNDLKVIYVVLCDEQWGMVKLNQQVALKPVKTMIKKALSAEETINADLGPIEWHTMARAMGAYGEYVNDASQLQPALQRCMAQNRPAVVHVDVDPVAHMWAPGLLAFKDMHVEPAGE